MKEGFGPAGITRLVRSLLPSKAPRFVAQPLPWTHAYSVHSSSVALLPFTEAVWGCRIDGEVLVTVTSCRLYAFLTGALPHFLGSVSL